MDHPETIAQVKKRAIDNYKKGLNCAESIFEAVLAHLDTGFPPEILCVMTGFGGGCGYYGDTCGALTGATAALGLVYGRRERPQGDPAQMKEMMYGKQGLYKLFNRLPVEFKKRFGSTLCRDLTQNWHQEWFTRDRLKNCLNMVGIMAEVTAEMVFPKNLEHWASQPFGDNVADLKD